MRKFFLAAFLTVLSVVTASSQNAAAKCPDISVDGPSAVALPGEPIFFRADISELPKGLTISFDWQVSAGKITGGQGTDQIQVVANEGSITATVTINGLPAGCPNSASEGAVYAHPVHDCPTAEYGNIPWPEEQAHLDNLFTIIRNNPNAQTFLYVYRGSEETVENTKKHIVKMLKQIKWRDRDFDLERLTFGIDRARHFQYGRLIKIFVVPPGANVPKCGENCTLLDGKHLYP